MRRFLPLLLAGSLWACSDSKTDVRDAGEDAGDHDHHHEDAGDDHDGGEVQTDAGTDTRLEQPPGNLERPPGEKLPDALKPPGFTH